MKRCNKCEEYDDPTTHKCSVRKIKPVATTDNAVREQIAQIVGDHPEHNTIAEHDEVVSLLLAAVRAYGEQCRVEGALAEADYLWHHQKYAEHIGVSAYALERKAALTSKRKEQADGKG